MYKNIIILVIPLLFASSCSNTKKSDAYGNFEATEIIVSAEASGKIMKFDVEEGKALKTGDICGYIDTLQLSLKKQQLEVQRKIVSSKSENILAQIKVLEEQKRNLMTEKNRLEKLLKDNAAPQQQMDNLLGQMNVIDKQIESVKIQNSPVFNELEVFTLQIKQLSDQIDKSLIHNPLNGIVLRKYAEPFEMVVPGKVLYKISDLTSMYLRIYVSGKQLPQIKLGQVVSVLVDEEETEMRKTEGEICWISDQVEFTPKIIQTKEERINMVYAVKVRVKNADSKLKIGMPGEVNFK